jgi:hypothetical protein
MPINLPVNSSDVASLVTIGVNDSGSGTSGSSQVNNVSPQIDTKVYISGKVTNEKGDPISNVKVTFNQVPRTNITAVVTTAVENTLDQGSSNTPIIIKPIVKSVTADANGEWSFTFAKTEIDIKAVKILFVKQDYKTEQIPLANFRSTEYPNNVSEPKKTSTPDTEPPYVYTVGNEQFSSNEQYKAQTKALDYYNKAIDPQYKGATLYNINKTLFPSPKPGELIKAALQSFVEPIAAEIRKLERTSNEKSAKKEVPGPQKVALTVEIEKENIKKRLIPFIIKLLIPFGMVAVQAVISKIPLVDIKDQILCPRQDKILELIKKRNKLVRQINSIYSKIKKVEKGLRITNSILTGLQIGISIIELIPYPATGVPPILPPLTSGIIEKTGSVKDKLKERLKQAKIVVNILTLSAAAFGAILGILLRLLNALDVLIQECSQSQDVPFETINTELNTLVNTSTGISNSNVISSLQGDEGATQIEDNAYNGFKLEIKLDEANTNKYPKRFAQALNKQGVPVLKTDSSFASDPQVLLDQLKFIIDSNPQLTAE